MTTWDQVLHQFEFLVRQPAGTVVEVNNGDAHAIIGLLPKVLAQQQAEDQNEDDRQSEQDDRCHAIANQRAAFLFLPGSR